MVNESIIKEIIAFANTKGGTIIVGYNDDGNVFGIENVKKEFDKLSNMIRDSIEPDVSFLLSQRIEKEVLIKNYIILFKILLFKFKSNCDILL
ncbi:MAG: ATP-binding protein [Clostridia bacterium]|nr:ATP-binding protein [Clostridia bacterium]